MRYIDNRGAVASGYPFNPNGSPDGLAGVTTADGRFTIMMPHPERTFRSVQMLSLIHISIRNIAGTRSSTRAGPWTASTSPCPCSA